MHYFFGQERTSRLLLRRIYIKREYVIRMETFTAGAGLVSSGRTPGLSFDRRTDVQ